jgi:hypothetical protein
MHCLGWLDPAIWRNIYARCQFYLQVCSNDHILLDSPEAAIRQDEEVDLGE